MSEPAIETPDPVTGEDYPAEAEIVQDETAEPELTQDLTETPEHANDFTH